MRVRPFTDLDAEALASLYARSVEELGARDYSAAQVAAWRARAPSAEALRERWSDGRTVLLVVDDHDRPLAFADLERDGHIDLLYAAPEAVGTGAAPLLYDELEAAARRQGIARLYAEASEAAKRFFTKRGFTVVARRDFQIEGVAIHNYAVEKRLPAGGRGEGQA